MEKEEWKELIDEIVKKIEPKDRMNFLFNLKSAFWGEKRALLQENILDRYDSEEYWDKESIED